MFRLLLVMAGVSGSIVATFVGTEAQSRSDARSANYLLQGCRIVAADAVPPEGQFVQATLCLGKLEALAFFASSINGPAKACPPSEAPVSQVAKVVVDYLDRHPAELHEPFLGLAYNAVAEAWPCK
jgi:hypothetical protein